MGLKSEQDEILSGREWRIAAIDEAATKAIQAKQGLDRSWRVGLLVALVVAAISSLADATAQERSREASSRAGFEAHLGRGYRALQSDRFDDAVREFRDALAIDPGQALRARFPLAVALFDLELFDQARTEFEIVRSSAGATPSLMYYLGRIDFMQGNLKGAIDKLTRAAAEPPFPDTAYFLGSAYLKADEKTSAEKWLRAAALDMPHDAHVQERLAALYQAEGREQESKRALERAGELRNQSETFRQQQTDCDHALAGGVTADGRAACAVLDDPSDAEKLNALGTLYGAHGDFQDALEPLRQAARLSPRSPQLQYNLALDDYRLGRYGEARTTLEPVVNEWPDLFAINALYGAALFKLGEETAAYAALRHAHGLDPENFETKAMLYAVTLDLGEKRASAKNFPEAIHYLVEAVQLLPEESEPHRFLSDAYTAVGRQSEAAEEDRRFRQLSTAEGAPH